MVLAPRLRPIVAFLCVLAGLPARTALVFDGTARWRVAGTGEVRLFRDGQPVELASLGSA